MGSIEDESGADTLYRQDLELVLGALRRRAPDVEALLHRLRLIPKVLRSQNARLGSPLDDHALDDLAQDVFIIVWRKLESYSGNKPLEAWAYRICRFELMNGIRRRQRRSMANIHPEMPARAEPSPWEYEDVHKGLETLSQVEAAVIQLKHFEGLTFDELAARLGISSNTAKTRYYRGLSRLEAFMNDRECPGKSEREGDPE